jgi:hypothetical protein
MASRSKAGLWLGVAAAAVVLLLYRHFDLGWLQGRKVYAEWKKPAHFDRNLVVIGAGAGGLGLLISEAVSLFQWPRLATIRIVVVAPVMAFDALPRRIRQALS